MSDKPKFEVIDRRKMKAEEEQENQQQPAETEKVESAPERSSGGPRLVVSEPKPQQPTTDSKVPNRPSDNYCHKGAHGSEIVTELGHNHSSAVDRSASIIGRYAIGWIVLVDHREIRITLEYSCK